MAGPENGDVEIEIGSESGSLSLARRPGAAITRLTPWLVRKASATATGASLTAVMVMVKVWAGLVAPPESVALTVTVVEPLASAAGV